MGSGCMARGYHLFQKIKNKILEIFSIKCRIKCGLIPIIFCQSEQFQDYLKIKFPNKNVKLLFNPSRDGLSDISKNQKYGNEINIVLLEALDMHKI